MHEFLRWSPKPKSFIPADGYDEEVGFRILRNYGPQAYREYTNLFEQEPDESNLPKLQVCKSCEEFRKVIPSCVYAEKEGKRAEDVAEFLGDDAYDGGRYSIKAIDDFWNLSSKLAEKHGRLGEIVQTLERTGDWNTYNRQMAQFDKQFRSSTDSIQRHAGRFSGARLSSRLRFRARS